VDAGGRKNERRILQTNADRVNSVALTEFMADLLARTAAGSWLVIGRTIHRYRGRARNRPEISRMVFCRRFVPTRCQVMNHRLRPTFVSVAPSLARALARALACSLAMATTVIVLASPINEAQAGEMYRWVDKNGVLNYSQIKPEGVNAEKVVTRAGITPNNSAASTPQAAEPANQPKLTEEQQRKLDELKALRAQEEQQVAEIKKANCDKSQKLLERLKLKERVRIRESDGSERNLGEDERQQKMRDAELGIATNCT